MDASGTHAGHAVAVATMPDNVFPDSAPAATLRREMNELKSASSNLSKNLVMKLAKQHAEIDTLTKRGEEQKQENELMQLELKLEREEIATLRSDLASLTAIYMTDGAKKAAAIEQLEAAVGGLLMQNNEPRAAGMFVHEVAEPGAPPSEAVEQGRRGSGAAEPPCEPGPAQQQRTDEASPQAQAKPQLQRTNSMRKYLPWASSSAAKGAESGHTSFPTFVAERPALAATVVSEELKGAIDRLRKASKRRLGFRNRKGKPGPCVGGDGTMRGYCRQCFDLCKDKDELTMMRAQLQSMVDMMDAAGKVETTDWRSLPPPC